jgi:hypothetical protein
MPTVKSDSEIIIIKPDIPYSPEDAFFPLRKRPGDNKILPSYQYKECVKRFIVCVSWETKTFYFEDLEWFFQVGYGLQKMPRFK